MPLTRSQLKTDVNNITDPENHQNTAAVVRERLYNLIDNLFNIAEDTIDFARIENLPGYQLISQKNQAGGYAGLNSDGLISLLALQLLIKDSADSGSQNTWSIDQIKEKLAELDIIDDDAEEGDGLTYSIDKILALLTEKQDNLLDEGGKIASAYLPSYVDEVIEVANFAALPTTGESGKIYITVDNNNQYRWSGSLYVLITASPGSTDAVPEGSTNKYWTNARTISSTLTGYAKATASAAITAVHTIKEAIQILEKKVDDAITSILLKVNKAGDTMTGLLTAPSVALSNTAESVAPILSSRRGHDNSFLRIKGFKTISKIVQSGSFSDSFYVFGIGLDDNNKLVTYNAVIESSIDMDSAGILAGVELMDGTPYLSSFDSLFCGRDSDGNGIVYVVGSSYELDVVFTRAACTISSITAFGSIVLLAGKDDSGGCFYGYCTTTAFSFTVVTTGEITNFDSVTKVFARSVTEWYLMGVSGTGADETRISRTANSGGAWTTSVISSFYGKDIYAYTGNSITVVGSEIEDGPPAVYRSVDSGVSWNLSTDENYAVGDFPICKILVVKISQTTRTFLIAQDHVYFSVNSGSSVLNVFSPEIEFKTEGGITSAINHAFVATASSDPNYIGVARLKDVIIVNLKETSAATGASVAIENSESLGLRSELNTLVSSTTLRDILLAKATTVEPNDIGAYTLITNLADHNFIAECYAASLSWDFSFINAFQTDYEFTIKFFKGVIGDQLHTFDGSTVIKTDDPADIIDGNEVTLTHSSTSKYLMVVKRIEYDTFVVISRF